MLAAASLVGCGGDSDSEAAQSVATTTEESSTESAPSPSRKRALQIEGQSLDGNPISLGDFHGRPVLVNVWSSW